jgi:hypothetical protein
VTGAATVSRIDCISLRPRTASWPKPFDVTIL